VAIYARNSKTSKLLNRKWQLSRLRVRCRYVVQWNVTHDSKIRMCACMPSRGG